MKQSATSLYIKMAWYLNAMLKGLHIYNRTVTDKMCGGGSE